MQTKLIAHLIHGLCLSLFLLIAPGCCWSGCFEKCKQVCNPCRPCDDSCVIKEPKKSNRCYQKNLLLQEEDAAEIIELEEEFDF